MKSFILKIALITLISILSNCDYSADTIGSFAEFTFNLPEAKLGTSLDKVIKTRFKLSIPEKWKDLDITHEKGYDVMNGKIVYFENFPEEMYFVDVIAGSPTELDTTKSTVTVRMVTHGYTWYKCAEFKKIDQLRIENRFYTEVVKPMESEINQKSVKVN